MIGLWFVPIVVAEATGNNSIVFTSELKRYYMANKVEFPDGKLIRSPKIWQENSAQLVENSQTLGYQGNVKYALLNRCHEKFILSINDETPSKQF